MKRILSLLLAALLAAGSLTACGPREARPSGEKGGLQIVVTVFPAYDWVMNVLGENPVGAEVTLLLDNGVDLHSFQPSAADILKITACDLLVCVGGESEGWVKDVLREAPGGGPAVVDLLSVLGDTLLEEEPAEGMQEEEHRHGEGGEPEETEYDEHVWLSLANAAVCVDRVAETLADLDAVNGETYRKNAAAYLEKLGALDGAYREAVSEAGISTLLFGDRFPFRYLTRDYGLSWYAAFDGCSAETEASFETVTFLAKKTDELGLHAVMTVDGSDQKIARTIVENTRTKDQQILTLDSMQSVGLKEIENGVTYLSVMESNLAVLKEALK